ncbi:MAG TPA: glycosyltransferase [Acidimicrobiales bacterium]|nr:glycosyltransferase [Acidimicrobiales bacterium]
MSRPVHIRRRRPGSRELVIDPGRRQPHILVVSASMGAGHNGAARELSRRLQDLGYATTVRDFLESGPPGIGAALRRSYELQLRYFPGSYEATYRMWFRAPWLCPPLARFVAMLTNRRLMRWIEEIRPSGVLSTYPLATLSLGELRRTGRLQCQVVNYITDFGVHPLWVHPSVDLNLAVHETAAERARAGSRRPSIACAPAVSESFSPTRLPDRRAARTALGLHHLEPAVLIAAGSWGVGSVEKTVRTVAAEGRFVPVVTCGNDRRLRSRLDALVRDEAMRAIVVGWTDDMPSLMAACDALVENAGGLTAFEAMRAGLPVITYEPIPGHGRENAAAMSAAGVARVAADSAQLMALLEALVRPGPTRAAQAASGANLFGSDPAGLVASIVSGQPVAKRPVGTPA